MSENAQAKQEFISVTSPCGEYRFVATFDSAYRTPKGLPGSVTYKVVGRTGGTVIPGAVIAIAPNWEYNDLIKKLRQGLRNISARMFFKFIARKPELWNAWEHHDYNALREAAPRYVLAEELTDEFFSQVIQTERLIRTPKEGERYFHRVECLELIRCSYKGHELRVRRTLEMICPNGNLESVTVGYGFLPSGSLDGATRPYSIDLKFKYPLKEWPMLQAFIKDPRNEAILDAWIDNAWTEQHREKSLGKAAV